jgi:DNA-binding CsgD family transcriptional regulator
MSARWSDAEKQRLREALASGRSYAQAADLLGRSDASVREQARRLGVRAQSGLKWSNWSEQEIAQLRAGIASGLSYRQLARAMNRSRQSIGKHARRLGLAVQREKSGPRRAEPPPEPIDPVFYLAAHAPWTAHPTHSPRPAATQPAVVLKHRQRGSGV